MDLFTYLLKSKGKNSYPHKSDLFAYLLGSGYPSEKTASGTEIEIEAKKTKLLELTLDKESTQETTTGKNYFNIPSVSISPSFPYITYDKIDENNISITTTNSSTTYRYIQITDVEVEQNTTYYFKANFTNTNENITDLWVGVSDENVTEILLNSRYSNGTVKSFNTGDNTKIQIWLYVNGSTAGENTATWSNIQLTKANNDSYEPYTGGIPAPNPSFPMEVNTIKTNVNVVISDGTNSKTATIPLGNNEICGIGDYKDELIVDKTGHCYLNKKINKVILNGSEEWRRTYVSNSGSYAFWSLYTTLDIPIGKYGTKLCDSFTYQEELWSNSTPNHLAENSTSSLSLLFNVDNTIATTTDDWESWLSLHNTTVYYQLETPQLIDLNYIVDLTLYKGTNIITNNKNANMTIKYY